MLKSKAFWLRAGGAVAVVIVLVAAGLLALGRSAHASQTFDPMNHVYGVSSAQAAHPITVTRGKTVTLSSLPTVAVTGEKHFTIPYLTPWGTARYSQLKKQAANARTARAPQATDVLGLPLTVPGPNTPSITTISGQSSTTWTPSDMGIAVGDGFFVQTVNSSLAVYTINESTHAMALKQGPTSFNTFFGPLGSNAQNDDLSDPRAFYDVDTGRYFVQIDDFTAFHYYMAVSQTSDPTGKWNLYDLNIGSLEPGDYPDFDGLGFDSEAVYISGNFFTTGNVFTDSFIGVLCKAYLETGSTTNCGSLGSSLQTYRNLQDSDGTAFNVMPAYSYGAMRAEYFVDTDWTSLGTTSNKYTIWALANPLEIGGSETLTGITVGNATFALPPPGVDTTGDAVDTGDIRVSAPPVVRNGQLYFAITSAYVYNSTTLADIQWYQFAVFLNDTSLACPRCATIKSMLGFANPHLGYSVNAFDPAMAVDTDGNIFFTFQLVGAKLNLTTALYARRSSTYTYLPGPDTGVFLGGGQSNNIGGRSGDYTAVAIDPSSCSATGCYGVVGSGMIERTGQYDFNTGIGYGAYTIGNP